MLEAIPPQIITGVGWGGLIFLAVWFLFTDRLISRSSHLREVADKNDHIAYLRKTLEVRDAEAQMRTEQVQRLLSNSELTVDLLRALTREAGRGYVEPS
jgi:hypothetical protein